MAQRGWIARYTLIARTILYLCRPMPRPPSTSIGALPDTLPASLLREAASRAFAFHAGEFACYDLVIGSLVAVIVVLLWS